MTLHLALLGLQILEHLRVLRVVAYLRMLEVLVRLAAGRLDRLEQVLDWDLGLLQDTIGAGLMQVGFREDHLGRVRGVGPHALLLLLVQALQIGLILGDGVARTLIAH